MPTFSESVIIEIPGQVTIALEQGGEISLFQAGGSTLPTIRISGRDGDISLGGNGVGGDIRIFKKSTDQSDSNPTIELIGEIGFLKIGGNDVNGSISIQNQSGETVISSSGQDSTIRIGGSETAGKIFIYPPSPIDTAGEDTSAITLDGTEGKIMAGGRFAKVNGELILSDDKGRRRITLNAQDANGYFGGNGEEGNIFIFPSAVSNDSRANAAISLNGGNGEIISGGKRSNVNGDIILKDNKDNNKIQMNALKGEFVLRDDNNKERIRLNSKTANGYFGGNGEEGNILLFASTGDNRSIDKATIHLDGGMGDIRLSNADFAEDFDISECCITKVEPGTVMVFNKNGELEESKIAYDTKIAGVISGAGDYRPGIIMDRQPNKTNRLPVALLGKVMCKVDATYSAIEAGDLLTTSPTCGYAMKVIDINKSHGAIIGKALKPKITGKGLIPVLINMK